MDPKFSKFEAEVARLLKANIAIKNISILLSKPPKAIRDAIYRFKKKKIRKESLKELVEAEFQSFQKEIKDLLIET